MIVLKLKCACKAHRKEFKTWVAGIGGLHKKFGLAREFLAAQFRDDGTAEYLLADGLYETCEQNIRGFVLVASDTMQVLTREQAILHLIEQQEKIDNAIGRINSEGGITFTDN